MGFSQRDIFVPSVSCHLHVSRVTELVGYKPDDLIGRSALQFHHVLDSDHISRSLHTCKFLVNKSDG